MIRTAFGLPLAGVIISLFWGGCGGGPESLTPAATDAALVEGGVGDGPCLPHCEEGGCGGDDGCGGVCAGCAEGSVCQAERCVEVVADCATYPGYCYIPAGTFTMGSPEDEVGREADEIQHEVTITRGFFLRRTEVTQGEWLAVFENQNFQFPSCGEDCPADRLNWWDGLAYCNELSLRQGYQTCYEMEGCQGSPGLDWECDAATFAGLDCAGYRLPTESEWEYGARAGRLTSLYLGDITTSGCESDPLLERAGWYCGTSLADYEGCYASADWEGLSCGGTHGVGLKEPNGWGLYDMAGNINEWVWDRHKLAYPVGPVEDPMGPEAGMFRVMRGCSWYSDAERCRLAYRLPVVPEERSNFGLRPARTAL